MPLFSATRINIVHNSMRRHNVTVSSGKFVAYGG